VTLAPDEQLSRVRTRRSPVAAYLASFIFLGMALSVAGPALPYLREHAGVGIGASGFVLAGQSFGYILGSLAAGRKYDRGYGHRLLVGAGMVAVAAAVGLTAVDELWMVVAVFMIIGFSAAALDVGGNTLAVWSQPTERVGSTLNALHLCFGLGALATPLIVSGSLKWSGDLLLVGWSWRSAWPPSPCCCAGPINPCVAPRCTTSRSPCLGPTRHSCSCACSSSCTSAQRSPSQAG